MLLWLSAKETIEDWLGDKKNIFGRASILFNPTKKRNKHKW